ncbi:MAG: 50S ribosomal protein L23 [Simkaniaceae bacterium]|nr:50S ribosomal protein L23 [Simkaniaceae bacterium]
MKRSPYHVVKSRHVTEKAQVLLGLQNSESNKHIKRCDTPKYVFIVDEHATKAEIRNAVEEIYAEKKVRVTRVNTINVKPKKRRVRGRVGFRPGFRKAVVTLAAGDTIGDEV